MKNLFERPDEFEYRQEIIGLAEQGYLEEGITSIQINDVEWKYLATGYCRRVYLSPDGKTVAKVPMVDKGTLLACFKDGKYFMYDYRINHNLHEFACYEEAPESVKFHLPKCELLPNGILLQEFVTVIPFAHRELGIKKLEDGTEILVIFDCDVFLNEFFMKPEDGYGYFQMKSPFAIIPHKFSRALAEAYKEYRKAKYDE